MKHIYPDNEKSELFSMICLTIALLKKNCFYVAARVATTRLSAADFVPAQPLPWWVLLPELPIHLQSFVP